MCFMILEHKGRNCVQGGEAVSNLLSEKKEKIFLCYISLVVLILQK